MSIHAQDHLIDLCFGGRFQLLGIGTDNNDDDQNCNYIIHESRPPIIHIVCVTVGKWHRRQMASTAIGIDGKLHQRQR